MSKRDVARMWVQEITGGRKPRLCIEKGEDNLVVVATFESTNHSKYFEEIIHEMCEELKQYRVIGTVSEFAELKEKATAKKVVVIDVFSPKYSCKTYRCPSCNYKLISKIDGSWCGGTRSKCCEECGTVIDWSEGK